MSDGQLVNLDPAKVQADQNSRFGQKASRIESLATSIMETGGVLEPVLVEVLDPPKNGFTHRLIAGFYRHAAVAKLNAEQGAGLQLPAIIRTPVDATARLRDQLSENIEREDMSPMDCAVAIKQLLDAGVTRKEIRRIFARPTGKKGEPEPASNAWVNIVLRFLELPKTVQERIHTGIIGVEAAYELGKVPPEKRQAVIDRAIAERQRQLEIEERDEEKYLGAEKKLTDAQAKEKEAISQVDGAKAEVDTAIKLVAERTVALAEVKKVPFLDLDEKAKKETTEKLKAANEDLKGAQKTLKDSQNKVAKLLETAKKSAETVEEQRARLDAARKAVKSPPNKKAVSKKDVQKAAEAEGVNTGHVALSSGEKNDAMLELSKAEAYPKAASVGLAALECFKGATTNKEMIKQIAYLTGELAAPKAAKK